MKFTCEKCNEIHDLNEISFGTNAPAQWWMINNQEKSLSDLGEEQCVIRSDEGTSYYIRALLEIPVIGKDNPFIWGVWCSLSEASMEEMMEYWYDPIRIHKGPYFGWFSTPIPGYPDTMYLKSMVHQRTIGQRPIVILEPTDHPLAVHQRNGIDIMDLRKLVVDILHGMANQEGKWSP